MDRSKDRERALTALYLALIRHPDLRICQIISNATGKNDPFYVEDRKLAVDLDDYGSLPPPPKHEG